jgi:alkylation response protein AidB-like acyl-CoA dehydrogenase
MSPKEESPTPVAPFSSTGSAPEATDAGAGADPRDWFALHAEGLDSGSAVQRAAPQLLPQLVAAGYTRVGVPTALGGSGGDTVDVLRSIAGLAEVSFTAAFVLWSHRAMTEFLLRSDNAALRERWLPELMSGHWAGATGLSNAMKSLSGLSGGLLQATPLPDKAGWTVDGHLPWASNLRPEGFLVAAAIAPSAGEPAVVALRSDLPGLYQSGDLDLMALRGSHTTALTLEAVQVDAADVLHADARAFLARTRPAFLSMQCGLSVGLARASLRAATEQMHDSTGLLAPRLAAAEEELAAAWKLLQEGLAGERFATQPAELFRLRLSLADLVQRALMLELQASGGRAYLDSQCPGFARRWRESAFVPIITPSLLQIEAQLSAA